MLSGGNDMVAQITPAQAEEIILVLSALGPKCLPIISFIYSYEANIPKFIAMALMTVGVEPLHKVKIPSSLTILFKASNTFL